MKTLNFTDRLSYIAWRKEWREAYAQISLAIPRNKNLFKSAQRRIEMVERKSGTFSWFEPRINGAYLRKDQVYADSQDALIELRKKAKEMLEIRAESKVKSAKQRAEMIATKTPEAV